MLLKAFNKTLIEDREKTYLTSAASAADTSLTVTAIDNNAWADNDYIIVGDIGNETTEVMQINGAVSDGTSLTIDRSGAAGGLRYDHAVGTPIYRILYNRVEFSRNTTDTSAGVSVLTTIEIQPDDEFTRYEDTSNTTGYGFVRFNNQVDASFSSYSDGVNYESTGERSSRDPRTLWSLRKKVRLLLDEADDNKLTDEMIDDAINDKQRDIAHTRLWSFYEIERSLSSVADQFAYDIPSTVQKVHAGRFDTQPLVSVNKTKWDTLHWDTDATSADPSHFAIWNNQILIWQRPSGSAQTTTLNGAHNATTTTITVASTSGFNRGDYYRFIINNEVIYATASTTTTFTNALRGQEGTTAASHSDTDTVTERDIVYSAHVEPSDLLDTQERTSIPEPDLVAQGAAADLAFLLGKQDVHDRLLIKYENGIKDLADKYSSKQSSQFGRVKDIGETIGDSTFPSLDPNLYPRSINQ